MNVISNKIKELNKNINKLNNLKGLGVAQDTNFDEITKIAEEIVKLSSFLSSYKELDKEREKAVKETIMAFFDEENNYDGTLMECVGYCFGECD